MIVVMGHLAVERAHRDRFVELSQGAVRQARATHGCLDFAVSADPTDDTRVNVAERWGDRAALEAFRGSGPEGEVAGLIRSAAVFEYEV